MKRVALPVKGATAGNGATQAMPDEGYGEDIPMQDAGEEEAPNPDLCLSILDDIAVYTQRNSMKTNPEMLGVLIDISVDLTRSTVTAAPAAAGRGRSTGAGRSSTGRSDTEWRCQTCKHLMPTSLRSAGALCMHAHACSQCSIDTPCSIMQLDDYMACMCALQEACVNQHTMCCSCWSQHGMEICKR